MKNRLHLDLRPDDQAAEVARFEQLGARRADVGQTSEHTWVVLADPEGNEFCILRDFLMWPAKALERLPPNRELTSERRAQYPPNE